METPLVFKDVRVQTALVGFTIGAFVGGLGLGYYLGNRKGTVIEIVPAEEEEEMTVTEIDPAVFARKLVAVLEKVEEDAEPETEDETVGIVIEAEDYRALTETVDNAVEVDDIPYQLITNNVFSGNDDDWDYEAELSSREHERPYVIHYEEFNADDMGYRQETMTYYLGDDTMTDPQDTPIYNYQELMGELAFGHGSMDPNVVYIRNEVIHMEWEVLLHQGHFAHEVMGLEAEQAAERDELRHSAVPKFRRTD